MKKNVSTPKTHDLHSKSIKTVRFDCSKTQLLRIVNSEKLIHDSYLWGFVINQKNN